MLSLLTDVLFNVSKAKTTFSSFYTKQGIIQSIVLCIDLALISTNAG